MKKERQATNIGVGPGKRGARFICNCFVAGSWYFGAVDDVFLGLSTTMSSRAKFKPPPVGRNPYYDAEVMDDDDERWARNPSGDLGWAYTARTLGRLSTDALVGYLVNNAFTVPARDYNPSAPFVHIKFAASQGWDVEGEAAVTTVSLPHGYRLPLMFVHKYMWATILRTLPSEEEWQEARGQMVHLCRLCENLFRRAHAKALQGGMEKGWRCIMFDRLLCRFYKHWDKSNPNAVLGFAKTHGVKEYDRDVLKHGKDSRMCATISC